VDGESAGHDEVFALARSAEYLSNDHDVSNVRKGYKGITIPTPAVEFQGGFLKMDPPEQRHYRQVLNPYLSPAAVARWTPVVDELVRACRVGGPAGWDGSLAMRAIRSVHSVHSASKGRVQ
jgi:cytochrome P450